jgi:formate--tetrahydrofolate ligase
MVNMSKKVNKIDILASLVDSIDMSIKHVDFLSVIRQVISICRWRRHRREPVRETKNSVCWRRKMQIRAIFAIECARDRLPISSTFERTPLVSVKSDIEIAQAADVRPITEIASKLDIPHESLIPYGHDKAKINAEFIRSLADKPDGKLILVTAVSPTPAGEGKTTTTVGLGDALNLIGKKAIMCLREPSLGPCFGMKGGAAGGGYAQVVPMTDINLHFTGDFHAIGAANNLLAALIDNHMHWENQLDIDPRRVTWRRVVDMNDRTLRSITSGLGGFHNGVVREAGFDITVASEIMAIFCLATDLQDLEKRLGNIVLGYTRGNEAVSVSQLNAQGAMTALLMDALQPNLVQTMENNPALMHGGPFANIAHGCNSVMATKTALKLADYVVTEAGFGADLGAEKFFNIKCRKAGLKPDAVVLVATIKALKMHGGVAKSDLGSENVSALKDGLKNLGRHLRNLAQFGVPVVVGVNRFTADTDAEVQAVQEYCEGFGVKAINSNHWAEGGAGAVDLAKQVVEVADSGASQFRTLYRDDLPLWEKAKRVATSIYGADDIIADKKVRDQFTQFQDAGYGHYPVCMAKTQYSFSTDPNLLGAPEGHVVPIREVRLAAGAEFIVVVCGAIMTMPGLPRVPAADAIRVNSDGQIEGLF